MAKYPAKIVVGDIKAVLDGEHYNITSPFSAKDKIKALPGAKWNSTARVWQVKKRWHRKISETLGAAEVEQANAVDEARAIVEAAGVGVADFEWITKWATYYSLRFPYCKEAVAVVKAAGGRWEPALKAWQFDLNHKYQMLRAMLAAGDMIRAAIADEKEEKLAKEAAKQAQREVWAKEREQRNAEKAQSRQYRVICHGDFMPAVGDTIRVRGEWRVVEGHGKWFRADENLSSMGGPIGIEGEQVRYAYTIAASEAQIADAEVALAAEKRRAEAKASQITAIRTVAQGETAPNTGAEPEGEMIWEDNKNALVGLRKRIVLGADGYLYHLIYDGSDGAAWGDYNAGDNTKATRVLATSDLIQQIRGT